ncbi:hypothetical protein Kpol_1032p35 [Vanderwaltozyma polyspora DSM 70294]|uniref:Uncharacterized protein n=1 Tax=Vanderwaltozyma polyspora (strain ATCC 22028 / DSM 70294 / BCRC 21397 / CBS 2163 / NBRC 10782 / NRRL Y-8283 / UCD 57-17) TaxID=436907 RepID=A7TGY9_VANPO|nr:uncharacterized protein Kpol_1032p35 [Vanderwaltozyma polyspora DSM 70294]EDO18441.1 hypothetical protein Kpol_1032p35 [Vanderwaltozyma polyspora DSM 70294]
MVDNEVNSNVSKPRPELVYGLAHEYLEQAYKLSGKVSDEVQLQQYYTLISMGIKCLQRLKLEYSLTVEQDAKITLELVHVLLNETNNLSLAEDYLSSLRERLKNHKLGVLNEKLHCEFIALYEIPMKYSSEYYYKMSTRSCDSLLEYLKTLESTQEVQEFWVPLFSFINIWLNIKIGKKNLIRSKFNNLLEKSSKLNHEWEAFIILAYVSFLLDERYTVPPDVIEKLNEINTNRFSPTLVAWRMVLELMMQIYKEENITNKLNEFKEFFNQQKSNLENRDNYCIKFDDSNRINITLPLIFNYKDLKNILLLLQSISYLVNCYDKNANFSTKFLPKVQSTTKKLIDSLNDKSTSENSLSYWDAKINWYKSIISYCNFYQLWEQLILTPQKLINNDFSEISNTSQNSFDSYHTLMEGITSQIKGDGTLSLDQYSTVVRSKNATVEIRMISLLNSFIIKSSEGIKNEQSHQSVSDSHNIWQQVEKLLEESDLKENSIWECTLTILWVTTHFKPFTDQPLPCTDEERSHYLEKLRVYYNSNKIQGLNDVEISVLKEEGKYLKLKKGLLLRILLNYLGCSLFEHDLESICKISEVCFNLSKLQDMPVIRYIIGLWHLISCTSAMKSKEVTITRAKLEQTVQDIIALNQGP